MDKNKTIGCFLYIIKVDNHGKKSRHFGHKEEFYTGITDNIYKRFQNHLYREKSGYLKRYFYDAKKKLVFVGCVKTEELYIVLEKRIKKLTTNKKKTLINSSLNILISHKVRFGKLIDLDLLQPPPFYLTKENLKSALKGELPLLEKGIKIRK